ncbi:MAG: aminopeptidase P family protein [Myxococcota bacterium]
MKRWKPAAQKLPAKAKGHARFRVRRRALARAFPSETLIIPAGHEKTRANDTSWRFRPGSDFYYLTGNQEPDCVLILAPKKGGGHEDILFVEPNPGRKDSTFFTDREKGELWVGRRLGVDPSRHRYQVDRCEPLPDVAAFIRGAGGRAKKNIRVLRGLAADIERLAKTNKKRDAELATRLSELRLVKDDMEVAAIKRACASTRRAFDDVVRSLKTAKSEREVEGIFALRARMEGNDVGYNVIAASGPHACILHWNQNDGLLRKRDLVLIDAGVESNEIYTADITRTLPISGKFTAPQREMYDLVIEAQNAAIAAVKPGAAFMDPHRAATEVLARGLDRLGLLPMGADEALRPVNQFYKRYTLHNTSHMLGLDVHDCAHAGPDKYKNGTLEVGMVLTVEPGLYFQLDDMTVPVRYRGIGIRVEDDVLVTARGCRLLSDLPRQSDDVERWMKQVWRRA